MSWLLGTRIRDAERRADARLRVGKDSFANSAAKFWMALLDDVHEEFPQADSMHVGAMAMGLLSVKDLEIPRINLDRLLFSASENLETMGIEAAAEMEITGWPAPVGVELFSGGEAIWASALPMDCLDSEMFSHILAWLLTWSRIEPATWNCDRSEGLLDSWDGSGERHYCASVLLSNRMLREGLIQRTVSLAWSM